jgi:spore maturation protein CgeB
VRSAVHHAKTREIYGRYRFSLNVNTVEDSPTMFSRRLIEIMGSGGLAVTTPAISVSNLFDGLCHVVESEEQARELFTRLKHGRSRADRDMISEASQKIHQEFTWEKSLEQIFDLVDVCRR